MRGLVNDEKLLEHIRKNGPCSSARILEAFPGMKHYSLNNALNRLRAKGIVVSEYDLWRIV